MQRARAVVLLGCLTLAVLCACGSSDKIQLVQLGPDRAATIVLPTVSCGDFFVATTYLDGAGPFAMLLDTGASRTQLSPRAAEAADVRSTIRRIDIGELHVEGRIRCDVRDLDHLADALGIEIDGILGHRVFQKVLLTYDFPGRQIRVRIGALSDDLPGVAPMSTSHRPMLGAMLGETKINVLLDTGSSNGLSLSGFDEYRFAGPPQPVGARMRIDGLHVTRAGRLGDDVRFGSFTLAQPIVRDAVGRSLLGQDILRDYVLTIDQQRGRMQMVRSDGAAARDPITSSGLFGAGWALMPDQDRIVVRRVFAGSAAEAAGFQPDDILLSANGIRLSDLGCERHGPPKELPTHTTYVVERDGVRLELELTTAVLVR